MILTNLALLLTGFAVLSRHFEQSNLPDLAPKVLPDNFAVVCFVVFAVPAALAQQRHQPIQKHELADVRPDWSRVAIVVLMLIAAIGANVITNIVAPHVSDLFR